MRPEANLQLRGGRSSPGFSGPLASSGSLVVPLHRGRGERRNIRHHQPQKPTVRESGAAPDSDWITEDGEEYSGYGHRFPNGGNGCVDMPGGGNPHGHDHCSRCGGTSSCHSHWERGECHILCGPGGFAAASAIEEALTTGDAVLAAAALRREWEGVSVEFIPDAGRVDLILACDPNRTFRRLPVLPSVRQRLVTELGDNSSLVAAAQAAVP